MTKSLRIGTTLAALLVGLNLALPLPAHADGATSETYDQDKGVDQNKASSDHDSVQIHHVTFDDPFKNERIHWLTPQAPSAASWGAGSTALPGSWAPSRPATNVYANGPAPMLNLPNPQAPFTATAVPKATARKLRELAKKKHAAAPVYRYHYGTANERHLAGDAYYHYGSYRNNAPRKLSTLGTGTFSNSESSPAVEGP